jgi:hypothetical protein|tara:strand:+ start:706 stop:942 length:237 start_codon:yes stop_codon:yes gene_type:complete
MKKYLFGLGAMLVGAGLMFVLMHGEVSADDVSQFKCTGEGVNMGNPSGVNSLLQYCKINDLTCVIGTMGISCVRGSMF